MRGRRPGGGAVAVWHRVRRMPGFPLQHPSCPHTTNPVSALPPVPHTAPPRPPGLNLLAEMVTQFSASEYATQFYCAYYLQLMQEILAVMTGG